MQNRQQFWKSKLLLPHLPLKKDKELVQFYLECFDRPAFQDDIYQEGRMEDFDKAIEDTLIALNTGVLRTRDGSILKQADGKSSVQNSLWREKLYTITDMLTAIRRRLKIAKKEKAYSTYGTGEDVAIVSMIVSLLNGLILHEKKY